MRVLRDLKVIELLLQTLALGFTLAVLLFLIGTARARMQAQGIPFSFGFLQQEAGFSLSEGITWVPGAGLRPYGPTDTYTQAFLAGFLNTLRVVVGGLVLATLLGFVVGIARLSSHPLARGLALAYVELVRNTPLLLQLFVWYFAVLLKLPPVEQALRLFGAVLSKQGLFLPWPRLSSAWGEFQAFFWGGVLLLAVGLALRRGWYGMVAMALVWGAGVVLGGLPLVVEFPVRTSFGLRGGLELSPEFAALLFGLVVYTASFIAEIVRGAVLAVPRGQWEAARALGLSAPQVLRWIILPQAIRIVLPPLANQYLNLTKNSSLAVAVGFPDLFSVYNTIANQSGRSLEGIVIVMGVYLVVSLSISALVNLYNRRVALRWGV